MAIKANAMRPPSPLPSHINTKQDGTQMWKVTYHHRQLCTHAIQVQRPLQAVTRHHYKPCQHAKTDAQVIQGDHTIWCPSRQHPVIQRWTME